MAAEEKRVWFFVQVLVCCFTVTAYCSDAYAKEIVVYENESIVLALDFQFSEYALGSPDIADCLVRTNNANSREMIINGVKAGITNLIFWDSGGVKRAEYTIRVKARNMGDLLKEVREIIGDEEGLRAEIAGKKIIIRGKALSPVAMARVVRLTRDNSNVLNAAVLSKAALAVLARTVNSFVGAENQIQVRPVGQTLVLHGISYGKGSAARAERFARIYHDRVVNLINEQDIDLEPRREKTVQVYAHFLEVKKNALKAVGFKWSPLATLSAGGSAGRGWEKTDGVVSNYEMYSGQVIGFLSNLLPKFTNARDRSMGRQLKVSSVSVRSGDKVRFQSGGEVGIPVSSPAGVISISFKQYGMLIEVQPIAHGDYVTMKIKVRINYPVNTGSAMAGVPNGYMNFTLSELETVQYCKSGNSIALVGLLDNVDRKAFDGHPGAEGALFELFRSSDFQKEESDLVVMITPEILEEAKNANVEIKQRTLESFEAYEPLSR